MKEDLIKALRQNHALEHGTVSLLTQKLGFSERILGTSTFDGFYIYGNIPSEEIREALREPIAAIIETVTRTLEKAEPELAADLIDSGLIICGGGSLLRGMDTVIANATGLKVTRAEDAMTCVARGTSVYLENLELWKDTMDHNGYGWE